MRAKPIVCGFRCWNRQPAGVLVLEDRFAACIALDLGGRHTCSGSPAGGGDAQ